jgi:hypothetical protein
VAHQAHLADELAIANAELERPVWMQLITLEIRDLQARPSVLSELPEASEMILESVELVPEVLRSEVRPIAAPDRSSASIRSSVRRGATCGWIAIGDRRKRCASRALPRAPPPPSRATPWISPSGPTKTVSDAPPVNVAVMIAGGSP